MSINDTPSAQLLNVVPVELPQEAPSVLQKDSSIIGNRQKIVEVSPVVDLLVFLN